MCDVPNFNTAPKMYKKIDRYFNELRCRGGWEIQRLYKGNACNNRYDLLFRRCVIQMGEPYIMEHFHYEVSLNHTTHRNGKTLYIVNDGDYYWTEDEVIDKLEQIGIK
jgi:hypothetical protein